ncbi:MAG: flagellar hook-basal body complex protein FliE [Actinomycetes bacterium]
MSGVLPVSGVSGVAGPGALSALVGATGVDGAGAASGAASGVGAADGGAFAAALTRSLDNVQALQGTADKLAVKAATGDLTDVHDYTIAATEARVATELTVAVRNKAVEAFNEIMRMQA